MARIMVVDDEGDVRLMIKSVLEADGHLVMESSGRSGLP